MTMSVKATMDVVGPIVNVAASIKVDVESVISALISLIKSVSDVTLPSEPWSSLTFPKWSIKMGVGVISRNIPRILPYPTVS